MTVYVDPLQDFGWLIRGRETSSCHMFSDSQDLGELHRMAAKIGLKRAWFQTDSRVPHYDLTPSRRELAVRAGVREVGRREAVGIWRAWRVAHAAAAVVESIEPAQRDLFAEA